MKRLPAVLVAVLSAAALFATPVRAADPVVTKKPPTAQQQRMKDCNAEARGKALKGDPRKQFMRQCLKGKRPG